MHNNCLLSFDIHLSKSNQTYIQHAKADIFCGDVIMLFGQSGSGKSTLLSILAKLIPASGIITLHTNPTSISQYRHQVALLQQTPYFVSGTVLDNLRLVFEFSYHKNNTKQPTIDEYIQKLAIFEKSAEFLKKDIQTLSGGEKQIVHFLRTLQVSPKVLLLDEPTAALDEINTKRLIHLFLTYQQQNPDTACVWISHNPSHQNWLCPNKIWYMRDKKLYIP